MPAKTLSPDVAFKRITSRVTLTTQRYSWGVLRILRKRADYACIIHPDCMDAIEAERDFIDEQGNDWMVTHIHNELGTCIDLRCGSRHFAVALEDLQAGLGLEVETA